MDLFRACMEPVEKVRDAKISKSEVHDCSCWWSTRIPLVTSYRIFQWQG